MKPFSIAMTTMDSEPTTTPVAVAKRRAAGRAVVRDDASALSVMTLALWLTWLTVGMVGLSLAYSRPHEKADEAPPVEAELIQVELAVTPDTPPPTPPKPRDLSQPPPLQDPLIAPQTPPMISVAAPSPLVAFAMPVEAPAKVVEVKQASYVKPVEPPAPAPPAPVAQTLTFGLGEGRQPRPHYPRQSVREGQEGTVTVRFMVGADGRVKIAEGTKPCPWPLLNESALETIRRSWRFAPGKERNYEVNIRFELNK